MNSTQALPPFCERAGQTLPPIEEKIKSCFNWETLLQIKSVIIIKNIKLSMKKYVFKNEVNNTKGKTFWTDKITPNSPRPTSIPKDKIQPWKGGSPNLKTKARCKIKSAPLVFNTQTLNKTSKDAGDWLKKYFKPLLTPLIPPLLTKIGINLIIANSIINHWKIGQGSLNPIIIKNKFNEK